MKKLTLEIIVERLKILNPTVTILSTEYIGTKSKLKCYCNTHKEIWYASYGNLTRGSGCPKCFTQKINSSLKRDFNELKAQIEKISPNILILSEEYVNSHSSLECICITHNKKWNTTASTLLKGGGCPTCASIRKANGRRLSFEDVESRISTLAPNLTLISDKYIGAKEKLKFRCNVCGNEFEKILGHVYQDQNCPKCSLRLASGENSVHWKGGVKPIVLWLREKAIIPWKQDSSASCKYKCIISGKKFNDTHHLVGFGTIVNETLEKCNLPIYKTIGEYTSEELKFIGDTCLELHYKYGLGVCLTSDIHTKFHQEYGYGDNTPEQFEEFKKNYKAS